MGTGPIRLLNSGLSEPDTFSRHRSGMPRRRSSCVLDPRLHGRGRGKRLNLRASIGVSAITLVAVDFVNDLHVSNNLAFDAIVGLALHLALFLHLLATLPHVLNRHAHYLGFLILDQRLVHVMLLLVLIEALALGLPECTIGNLVGAFVKRVLLLQKHLLSVLDHFIFN